MSIQRTHAEKRARVARALAREGFYDVYVLDRESADRVLTEGRTAVLDRVREGDVESVRGLARALGRDKGAVSRDLDVLAEHDLVAYREEGARKVLLLKH